MTDPPVIKPPLNVHSRRARLRQNRGSKTANPVSRMTPLSSSSNSFAIQRQNRPLTITYPVSKKMPSSFHFTVHFIRKKLLPLHAPFHVIRRKKQKSQMQLCRFDVQEIDWTGLGPKVEDVQRQQATMGPGGSLTQISISVAGL